MAYTKYLRKEEEEEVEEKWQKDDGRWEKSWSNYIIINMITRTLTWILE